MGYSVGLKGMNDNHISNKEIVETEGVQKLRIEFKTQKPSYNFRNFESLGIRRLHAAILMLCDEHGVELNLDAISFKGFVVDVPLRDGQKFPNEFIAKLNSFIEKSNNSDSIKKLEMYEGGVPESTAGTKNKSIDYTKFHKEFIGPNQMIVTTDNKLRAKQMLENRVPNFTRAVQAVLEEYGGEKLTYKTMNEKLQISWRGDIDLDHQAEFISKFNTLLRSTTKRKKLTTYMSNLEKYYENEKKTLRMKVGDAGTVNNIATLRLKPLLKDHVDLSRYNIFCRKGDVLIELISGEPITDDLVSYLDTDKPEIRFNSSARSARRTLGKRTRNNDKLEPSSKAKSQPSSEKYLVYRHDEHNEPCYVCNFYSNDLEHTKAVVEKAFEYKNIQSKHVTFTYEDAGAGTIVVTIFSISNDNFPEDFENNLRNGFDLALAIMSDNSNIAHKDDLMDLDLSASSATRYSPDLWGSSSSASRHSTDDKNAAEALLSLGP